MHLILFKPQTWELTHNFYNDYPQSRELKIDGIGKMSTGRFFPKNKDYECRLTVHGFSNKVEVNIRRGTSDFECYVPDIGLSATPEIFDQILNYLKLKQSDEICNLIAIFEVDDESITEECWLNLDFKEIYIGKFTLCLGNFKSIFEADDD